MWGILESCHQREIPRGTHHTGPKLVTSHRPSGDKGFTEGWIHPKQPERSPSTMQATRLHSTCMLRDGIREHNMGPSHQHAQQKLEKIQHRAARWATSQNSHRTSVTSLMHGPAEMATPGRPKRIQHRLFHAPTRTTSSGCLMLHRTVHAFWNLYGNPYRNRAEKEEETVTWWGNS